MKFTFIAIFLLLIKIAFSQTAADYKARKIEFGFSSSTFTGASANYITSGFLERKDLYSYLPINKPGAAFANFGWKQGLFIWVNLNSRFSYKAQVDAVFCISQFEHITEKRETTYCRSFGLEYKPQLVIRLGTNDPNPVIKMARDMSYYLTGRQSYLIIGPKFSYSKPDKSFLRDNDLRYASIGGIIGIGADHLFPNLNFAPELLLSVEYKTGRFFKSPSYINRYYVSLSLAVNFF